jgi:hypothetical protein
MPDNPLTSDRGSERQELVERERVGAEEVSGIDSGGRVGPGYPLLAAVLFR